jgi:cyanuric acid amidohydrolase
VLREAFVDRVDLPDPADANGLAAALAQWNLRPRDLLCVLAKTPGNGLTNDYSRPLAVRTISTALAAAGLAVPMILASGGTEGIGIPHITLFGRRSAPAAAPSPQGTGLAIGHGIGPAVSAAAIGTPAMVEATATAVLTALADAGIDDPAEATLAIVKAPLSPAETLVLDESGFAALKSRARAAAALGAAVALGDQTAITASAALTAGSSAACCGRVLVSAATDDMRPQAVVLGRAAGWGGRLAAATAVMADMLDTTTACHLLHRLGLHAAPQLATDARLRVRAVLAKGELPRHLRGASLPASDDSDIHPNRHFRAAIGGVLGALIGDGRIYLSGGSEHQVPAGGVLLAVVAEQTSEVTWGGSA